MSEDCGRKRLLDGLRGFETLAEVRRSSFFAEHGAELDALLSAAEILPFPGAVPRLGSFLRVAQWNIEKGKRWRDVVESFQSDPTLKWADVILLNEADLGMVRSDNVHVAARIASCLGMHMAFGPAHFELTKGTDDELQLPGENLHCLQGNAVLSRHPILEARVVPLPVCFEPFEFHEKRYGRRNCTWARLEIDGSRVWMGAVHLEVRNTPRCRATQMRHTMEHLPGAPGDPHLLGGDMNSNGFPRGTRLRTFRSIGRLILRDAGSVKEELLHPERGAEPLFRIARQAGFTWQDLNSYDETAGAPMGTLEEAGMLPGPILRFVRRRLAPYGDILSLKLDWLLGRGVEGLRNGEVADARSGACSQSPGRVPTERSGSERISDHSPVCADLRIPISSKRSAKIL